MTNSVSLFFFLARTNLEPPPDVQEPTAEEGQQLIKRSDFTFINLRCGLRLKEGTESRRGQKPARVT